MIWLPDGRYLQIGSWLESYPPIPAELRVLDQLPPGVEDSEVATAEIDADTLPPLPADAADQSTVTLITAALAAVPTPLGVLAVEVEHYPQHLPDQRDVLVVSTYRDDDYAALAPHVRRRYAKVASTVPFEGGDWELLAPVCRAPSGHWWVQDGWPCLEERVEREPGRVDARTPAGPRMTDHARVLLLPAVLAWADSPQCQRLWPGARQRGLARAAKAAEATVAWHSTEIAWHVEQKDRARQRLAALQRQQQSLTRSQEASPR